MATLQIKKVKDALNRARGIGLVEDEATIAGCSVVLRSLRPEEYEAIHEDTHEKEDIAYLNAYRAEHLCRSIIQIEDVDFRQVDSVEVEDPEDASKTIRIEKHAFIRDYVIATWSREAVDVAFRKFGDVVAKSDQTSSQGVKFDTPDETPEEKYRRIISELKEVEGQLPADFSIKLLEESGYTRRVSAQDFELAEARLSNMGAPRAAVEEPPQEEPEAHYEEPAPLPPPPVAARPTPTQRPAQALQPPTPALPRMPPVVQSAPASRPATAEDLMRLRKPLNQQAPVPQPAPQARATAPALTRSQLIAQEEEGFEPVLDQVDDPQADLQPAISGGTMYPEDSGIPELRPQPKLDPQGAASVLDRPPVGGRNSRFRPPPRL